MRAWLLKGVCFCLIKPYVPPIIISILERGGGGALKLRLTIFVNSPPFAAMSLIVEREGSTDEVVFRTRGGVDFAIIPPSQRGAWKAVGDEIAVASNLVATTDDAQLLPPLIFIFGGGLRNFVIFFKKKKSIYYSLFYLLKIK
jgi:hypothetical protein